MSNPQQRPHSVMSPYGFMAFGPVAPMQFGPGQPMFFSPTSSMTSIPAMFDVQGPSETNFNVQPNTAAMFANQTMMQPIMLMSPQPPGHLNDPRFATYPVMRNSMMIQSDPSVQQQQLQQQHQQQLQQQQLQMQQMQQQQLQLQHQQQLSTQQQQQLLLLQQQQQQLQQHIPSQQQQLTQQQQQQQFRVIYQPMLVRMGPDGTSWQMVEEGAPPDVVGDYRQEEDEYFDENQSTNFQPDVVPIPTDEPTYMNGEEADAEELPSYANEQETTEQNTYTNNDSEPIWSTLPYTSSKQSPQFFNRKLTRGNSLPPQLKPEMTPVAPPRSRRGSRRGSMTSLADSTQSLDVTGLAERLRNMGSTMTLKELHPVHKSSDPPIRPTRRKDQLRKSMTCGLAAIEEDLPKPAMGDDRQKSLEPRVPMPGTAGPKQRAASVVEDNFFGRARPAVPMPGSLSYSKSVSDMVTDPVMANHKVAVPMPGSTVNVNLESTRPASAMPGSYSMSGSVHALGSIPIPGSSVPMPGPTPNVDQDRPVSTVPRIPQPTGSDSISNNRISILSSDTFHTATSVLQTSPEVNFSLGKYPFGFSIESLVSNSEEKSSLAQIGAGPFEMSRSQSKADRPESQMSMISRVHNGENNQDHANSSGDNIPSNKIFISNSDTIERLSNLYASAARKSSLQNSDHEKSEREKFEEEMKQYQSNKLTPQEKLQLEMKQYNLETKIDAQHESENKMSDEEKFEAEMKQYEADHEAGLPALTDDHEAGLPVSTDFLGEEFVRERIDRAFRAAFFGFGEDGRTFENCEDENPSEEETEAFEATVVEKPQKEKKKSLIKVVKKERRDTVEEGEEVNLTCPPPIPSHGKQEESEQEQDPENLKKKSSIDVVAGESPNDSDTDETLDVTIDIDDDDATVEREAGDSDGRDTVSDFFEQDPVKEEGDRYNELVYKAVGASWDEVPGVDEGLPPPLILHSQLRSVKLDLLSSIFQNLYPTEQDCVLVCQFMSCPASLEEKYTMIRLADLLKRNKRMNIELESLAEAMGQLAKIGQELMRPEDDRDPMWRTIPVAKEIMVSKGIATRAPWESIEGGREILESLGYTEYTGFALQYPRSMMPEFFADHIGNLTVELVLAAVEISTLLIRVRPNLETLAVLQEAEAFPGNDAEVYYPEVPMLSQVETKPGPEPTTPALNDPSNNPYQGSFFEMKDDLQMPDLNRLMEEHEQVVRDSNKQNDQHHLLGGRRHIHESEYEEIGPPPQKNTTSSNIHTNGSSNGFHNTNGNSNSHTTNSAGINRNISNGSKPPCDLCGTASAMVKCHLCSDQIFCLACDDMYHRHPKRSTHPRKAILEQPAVFRPPLPPKGEASTFSAPVAPPRRNVRKGSTPDSPFNGRQSSNGFDGPAPPPLAPKDGHLASMSRSSTLPRKSGSAMSMVGRPLPPPPPANSTQPRPRDHSVDPRLARSQSMAQQSGPSLPSRQVPPPPSSVSNFGQDSLGQMSSLRKLSTCSQPPMHLQAPFHGQQQQQLTGGNMRQQPEIPMPGQMNNNNNNFPSYPSSSSRIPAYRPQQQQQHLQHPQQFGTSSHSQRATSVANSLHSQMGPRPFQQSYPDMDGPYPSNPNNMRMPADDPWNPGNPYHEEVQFPPQQSFQNRSLGFDQGSQTLSRRSAVPSKNRNRFSKLNKSSSLHDIAHGIAGNGSFMNADGVTWEDQHWSTTQSSFQQPTLSMSEMMAQQNGNFKRATSTKSLHQLSDPWNSSVGMWNDFPITQPQPAPQAPNFVARPTFNPMMNRWMAGHQMFNPVSMNGGGTNGNFHRSMHELNFSGPNSIHHPNSPGSSQKSSRSKKSGGRSSERKQTSSSSSKNRRSGTDSRSHSRSSRRCHGGGHQRRSETSEEEDLDEVSSEEEEDEDFFTGESDNDFVSLSSGSNSRRAPRKSWICEHCTYMNNPGVTVCTVCCRTTRMTRAEEDLLEKMLNSEEGNNDKKSKSSGNKSSSSNSKYRNRKKYNSSDEESEEPPKLNRKKNGGSSNKTSSLKRRGGSKGKTPSKSPLPKSPENTSDLEQDAINTYYAVRMDSKNGGSMANDGRYESSSEASNANNPVKRPNFEAPAPAKGILKKSSSNPQLTKIEQEAKSDLSQLAKKFEKQMIPSGPGKVVDIKKYLAQTQDNPKVALKNGRDFGSGDIWKEEQDNWIRQSDDVTSWRVTKRDDDSSPARSMTANAPENDYMSDVASQSNRMYRSVSGQSLGELELQQQEQNRQNQRRTSDVGGKKNFRSKRFSRNLERDAKDPTARRSHSLHMERTQEGDRWVEMHSGMIKKVTQRQSHNSESSSEEAAPIHFTATVEGETRGPGGIGSYLSRKEFGSNEGPQTASGAADSGYISHSSGGHYPRMELPTQAPIEAFTMSVDRGYLGRAPGDNNPNMYRSMDDLTAQKATGLELVRLLRDAEQSGYTAEDIQVSLNHCGDVNPVSWLRENWDNMMDTVVTLASNVGHEAEENTIGTLSKIEAKEALRKHKGNIWAAVTECVEQRQLRYDELCSKGNFTREDIVTVLTAHQGNVEAAFQELNKATLKPFLMRIWGQAEPGEVSSGQVAPKEKEDVEATIVLTETGAKKKLSLEEASNGLNGYQPGNLLKSIDVPQQQAEQAEQQQATQEDLEKFKFDRQVRRLLAEGRITSYEKGELVVKLQEMEFPEEEALVAAEQCEDIYAATKFLQQECELCANVMNVTEIISMPSCEHKCCKDCASKHFTIVIKDRTISEARCPFCHEPSGLADPDEDDLATTYFAKLDIMLKSLIDQDVHDLFQRKLRDRTLMKDPNFKWCYKCSSGFIADPRNKKLVCPDCRAISCAKCLKPWEAQHEGISCEEFAAWKEANDPDNQAKGLERHMEENGIECPACKFKYALTKGGCMHFTCSQCKHEFCIGCNKPFKLGVKCGKGPGCAKMGLHSHHPRNCLFYLRDKEPADLQRLLKNNNIEYTTDATGEEDATKCRVQIQRELGDGVMKDDACGEESPKGFAGFCKNHYVEYLCGLVFRNSVEPVSLLDLGELQQVFTRANHFMPRQRPGEYEYQYKKRLSQVIENEIPLETA